MPKIKGKEGNLRGSLHEEKIVSLLSFKEKNPSWITSVYRGTKEDDENGIDVIVETTDVGPLYLQVKSSKVEARRFKRKHEKRDINLFQSIAVIVVFADGRKSDETIHNQTKHLLKKMRNDKINNEPKKLIYDLGKKEQS